jgi:hypothetical protein
MKIAVGRDWKALDYFTSTIAPCRSFRVATVLTVKHALLLLGFAVATMALARQLLADRQPVGCRGAVRRITAGSVPIAGGYRRKANKVLGGFGRRTDISSVDGS